MIAAVAAQNVLAALLYVAVLVAGLATWGLVLADADWGPAPEDDR